MAFDPFLKLFLVYIRDGIQGGILLCLLVHLEFDRLAGERVGCLHDFKLIGKMVSLGRGDGSGGSRHAVRGLVSMRNIM